MEVRTKKQIKATKIFYRTNEALLHSGKRYIVNEGGSRSSKSYSIMQVLIMYARNNPFSSITVCSRSLPALKKGAYRDFENIMKRDWGWYSEKYHNKSDHIYNFPNGSYIEFFGLEEADKAKGPGRKILFVNEANLISKDLFDQLNMRTEEKVLIDLNPSDFECWCYDVADGPDSVKIHSTFKDNPALPKAQRDVIYGYMRADPQGTMWKVYGLGLRGASEDVVYSHYRTVPELPGKGATWYGLDFGFNVPTALVKVELYDGDVYVEEMLYQTKVTTGELVEILKGLDIADYDEIYCDAAEPKTIQELYNAGFYAIGADKDVTEGIRKVKSVPLYITEKSDKLRKELGSYKWKKDSKTGRVLDEPDKAAGNDHLCDAMRYAIFSRLKNPAMDFFIK